MEAWRENLYNSYSNEELCHYGIKGQKWGIRRYQNEDGSLTDAGKKKYSHAGAIKRELNNTDQTIAELKRSKAMAEYRKDKALSKGQKENAKNFEKQIKDYDKRINEGKDITKKLISVAEKQNMYVTSKECMRYADQGKTLMAAYIGGIPGMLGSMAVDKVIGKVTGNPEAGGDVQGTYYKVKTRG